MDSRKLNGEVLMMGLVVLFSGYMFLESFALSASATRLPRLVSFVVLALSVYRVAGLLWTGSVKTQPKSAVPGRNGLTWPVSTLLMLVYWASTYVLGFMLATLLYFLAMPFLMGFRKTLALIVMALVVALGLTAALQWVFQMPVPGGIIFG